MTLNLVKLSVGAQSVDDLAKWQQSRLADMVARGVEPRLYHTTFQTPKRQAELLDGGSLYWVIKGTVQVRQRLIGFDEGRKENGSRCCLLLLENKLVLVRPIPRRAFQGWRYLSADDAPEDLSACESDGIRSLPPRMRQELTELCLI